MRDWTRRSASCGPSARRTIEALAIQTLSHDAIIVRQRETDRNRFCACGSASEQNEECLCMRKRRNLSVGVVLPGFLENGALDRKPRVLNLVPDGSALV